MNTITLTKTETQIIVASPYNPNLPSKAKRLGGKWSPTDKSWLFDLRDEQHVRELYISIYGTDGTTNATETVTIRATIGEHGWEELCGSLFLYGRQVARARSRDSGAILGDGVIVLKGGFSSGGSVKNWRTIARPGTVFELRDVPRKAYKDNGAPDGIAKIELLEEKTDKEALKEERKRLMARIAEINKLL